MPDTEILESVLDRWKAGIDAAQPERVAEVFTEDAIFQGLRPYSIGRQGVTDYYASQAPGMTVTYRILEARRHAADLIHGYVAAEFAYPDRPSINLYLGVLVTRGDGGWSIAGYQASRLD
jgi:uncharacterized protein (TIGR02246 family)